MSGGGGSASGQPTRPTPRHCVMLPLPTLESIAPRCVGLTMPQLDLGSSEDSGPRYGTGRGVALPPHSRRAREAEAADSRELQGRAQKIDADDQPEEIELQPFAEAGPDARDPPERDLPAGAARRFG